MANVTHCFQQVISISYIFNFSRFANQPRNKQISTPATFSPTKVQNHLLPESMFAADCLFCLQPHLVVRLELEHFLGAIWMPNDWNSPSLPWRIKNSYTRNLSTKTQTLTSTNISYRTIFKPILRWFQLWFAPKCYLKFCDALLKTIN